MTVLKHCTRHFRKPAAAVGQTRWEPVVGLEVHAQIQAKSKLFSPASTEFAAMSNSNVHFLDMSMPGVLPVLNRRCVEAGVLTALALNMAVNTVSTFDRKHYFYADMPMGYQITQQSRPLATGGLLRAPYGKDTVSTRLKQLQLEMDSGKSLHDTANGRSLIDLNRAGMALMELVFEPDLSSGEEAAAVVKELVLLLKRINTCSCRMEEGALRVDANVSVRPAGSDQLGVRSEVKNINSIRSVAKAVEYEIGRQKSLLEAGGRVINETRSFDPHRDITVVMRDKEVVQDYRFLPEPNLPPLRLSTSSNPRLGSPDVDQLRAQLPELPDATRRRLIEQYGVSDVSAQMLVVEEGMLEYFETICSEDGCRLPESVSILLRFEIMTLLKTHCTTFTHCRVPPRSTGVVFDLLSAGQVSSQLTLTLLTALWTDPAADPVQLLDARGWRSITDLARLEHVCDTVLQNSRDLVMKILVDRPAVSEKKRAQVYGRLVKQAREELQGRADMGHVASIMKRKLNAFTGDKDSSR